MIRHIVAMPPDIGDDKSSYFQGFSISLFPDYLAIFNALVFFPQDAFDPFLQGADFIFSKMAGSGLDVYLLRADLLSSEPLDFDRSLNIVWSTTATVDFVSPFLDRFDVRPVHITSGECDGAVSLTELTPEIAAQLTVDLIRRAGAHDFELAPIVRLAEEGAAAARTADSLNISPLQHNCTVPLTKLLKVYGAELNESRLAQPPLDSQVQYVEGITELVRAVDGLRHGIEELPRIRKNDALLFCPSNYTYLYRANSHHWNEIYRKLSRERRNFLKQALIRNQGFGNLACEISDPETFNPYDDEVIGPLLAVRQHELLLFTFLVSISAVNQFVPAIRLPNAVMLHHDRLANIYALVNSSRRGRTQELNRKVGEYSRTIQRELGMELMDVAFGSREKLLAVCDFPIEWISIDLLPAMFRYEMSRIPSTPGNLTAQVLLSGQRVMMPLSALADVLIVRSLAATDPIRNHLSDSVDYFGEKGGLDNLRLELVDVTSEAELIEALNQFKGMTVIFDCHGNHGGEESHAWLLIGAERVDVWGLANRTRIPPIVILAACSTHPLDGSHASVANGFLRSGAISVMGTLAPVSAIHTGVTIARLLYRMSTFIPIATKGEPRSWRDIVSGFLRMSYTTDVLRDLHHVLGAITASQYHKLHLDANLSINGEDPEWFDKLYAGIRSAIGKDDESLRELFLQRYQFVETMLFAQLGRPENLFIYNDASGSGDDAQALAVAALSAGAS